MRHPPIQCVIPKLGGLQPSEGSCEDHIRSFFTTPSVGLSVTSEHSPRPLHARSLAPLVKARGFGMTHCRRGI